MLDARAVLTVTATTGTAPTTTSLRELEPLGQAGVLICLPRSPLDGDVLAALREAEGGRSLAGLVIGRGTWMRGQTVRLLFFRDH